MVHIANGGAGSQGPIFFNVDKPVGQGAGVEPNAVMSADVQLVQYFLKLLGFYKPNEMGFSGRNDPETVGAISRFQLNHTSAIPDGRISVATGTTFVGGGTFAIVKLNELVRNNYQSAWPRIHLLPAGPPLPPILDNRIKALLGLI